MHMVTAMAPSARENGLLRLQVGKAGRFDIRFPSPHPPLASKAPRHTLPAQGGRWILPRQLLPAVMQGDLLALKALIWADVLS